MRQCWDVPEGSKWRRTRKMGCFRANFSIPPFIMLVLNVMMPAWDEGASVCFVHVYIWQAYHLDRATERHLRSFETR